MEPLSNQALIRHHRGFLLTFILVATLATMVFSYFSQPIFVTSLSITVNRVHRQETPDYQYDGYYAIQASDLFSQTILSWFLTPSVLLEFYEHADVDPHISSLTSLVGRFRARKFSAQNIVVQFSDPDRAAAEKLAAGIAAVVKERGESLNQSNDGQGIFEVAPAHPVIVETRPNTVFNTIVALVASSILGYVLVLSRRYLQN